jgi:hypothetical protein
MSSSAEAIPMALSFFSISLPMLRMEVSSVMGSHPFGIGFFAPAAGDVGVFLAYVELWEADQCGGVSHAS